MIILDDDVMGILIHPAEADAPLLIDTDTVFSLAVSFECFETVRRRDAEIVEVDRLVDHGELVQSTLLNLSRQLSRFQKSPKPFRLLVAKTFDHIIEFTLFTRCVNIISAKRSWWGAGQKCSAYGPMHRVPSSP